jgi:hypothetical protein
MKSIASHWKAMYLSNQEGIVKDRRQNIDDEIAGGRNEIRADKLDISFGEIANLYENKELIITPEYQRLFRW